MRMLGRRIELGKVTADTYYVAAEQDHITPWMSCYDSSRLLGGDVRFILSSSGHIAGIVNPPGGRRTFRTNDEHPADGREVARRPRRQHEGSWWDDWAAWMKARGGRRGKPPAIGNEEYPALCDAPGHVRAPRRSAADWLQEAGQGASRGRPSEGVGARRASAAAPGCHACYRDSAAYAFSAGWPPMWAYSTFASRGISPRRTRSIMPARLFPS